MCDPYIRLNTMTRSGYFSSVHEYNMPNWMESVQNGKLTTQLFSEHYYNLGCSIP